MFSAKLFFQPCEEFCLSLAVLFRNVVVKDGKMSAANRVDGIQLCEHLFFISCARISVKVYIQPRGDGEDEVHICTF